jgi:hypothetical protein
MGSPNLNHQVAAPQDRAGLGIKKPISGKPEIGAQF